MEIADHTSEAVASREEEIKPGELLFVKSVRAASSFRCVKQRKYKPRCDRISPAAH
jgi:hypothetical protein